MNCNIDTATVHHPRRPFESVGGCFWYAVIAVGLPHVLEGMRGSICAQCIPLSRPAGNLRSNPNDRTFPMQYIQPKTAGKFQVAYHVYADLSE